jgi:hypothetical protein
MNALGVRLSTVWKSTGSDIRDDEPPTAVCSLVFTSTCGKGAPCRMYRLAERQVRLNGQQNETLTW